MTIMEDWYVFTAKLPLYRCYHLLEQVPDEQLADVVSGLKEILRQRAEEQS